MVDSEVCVPQADESGGSKPYPRYTMQSTMSTEHAIILLFYLQGS